MWLHGLWALVTQVPGTVPLARWGGDAPPDLWPLEGCTRHVHAAGRSIRSGVGGWGRPPSPSWGAHPLRARGKWQPRSPISWTPPKRSAAPGVPRDLEGQRAPAAKLQGSRTAPREGACPPHSCPWGQTSGSHPRARGRTCQAHRRLGPSAPVTSGLGSPSLSRKLVSATLGVGRPLKPGPAPSSLSTS